VKEAFRRGIGVAAPRDRVGLERSEPADEFAASGRDTPAPRTRAGRGSRRAVNARGSSFGSFERSPGLSSSCTRPCQPSRRAGVRRRSGENSPIARSARRFSVASETSVQSDERGGLRTTAVGVRGLGLVRSKIHAGSRSVM
jgi:hypothetical protein